MKPEELARAQEEMRLRRKTVKEPKPQPTASRQHVPAAAVQQRDSACTAQSHHCATCGQETTNPRFCSRSCAATSNKLAQSRVRGECARCWVALSSRKKYCPECSAVIAAEEDERQHRKEMNYRSWLTPSGELREAPILQITSTVVFESHRNFDRDNVILTPERPVSELIDLLIGVCFNHPPYLREADTLRYVSLLHELRGFKTQDYYARENPRKDTTAGNLKIDRLAPILENWVRSYFVGDDHHAMMPAYALDAARFLQMQIASPGGDVLERQGPDDGPYWKLEPLVILREGSLWDRYDLFGRSFRAEFSRSFGPLVRCTVPEGGSLKLNDYPVLKGLNSYDPGDQFLFRIRRCHLTGEAWGGDANYFECEDRGNPRFDLMNEFQFFGNIYPDEFRLDITGVVPGWWITDAVRFTDAAEGRFAPIPRWDPLGMQSGSRDTIS
jgi:hypothetical protein